MAAIRKQETTGDDEDVEKGDPSTLIAGMSIGTATVENSMKVPQKIKNRITI